MKMDKLPCEVVKDLLPSYADGLTNGRTNELIEEHAAGCEACRRAIAAMRGDEPAPEIEAKELDFLKKNSRRNRRILIGSLLAAALLALTVLFLNFYVLGVSNGSDVLCRVDVDGDELSVVCSSNDEKRSVSSVEFTESEGGVDIRTRTVAASPLFPRARRIEKTFKSGSEIKSVRLNGRLIYSGGDVMLSEELRGDIRASWKHYNELSEMERMLLSTTPGYCDRYVETWEEAVRLLGFEPWDPFENDSSYVIADYTGTRPAGESAGIGTPEGFSRHINLNYSGDETGEKIHFVNFNAGYIKDGLKVQFNAHKIDPESNFFYGSEPDGAVKETFTAENGSSVIVSRTSGERFDRADIRFELNGLSYDIGVVNLEKHADSETFERVVSEITEKALEAVKLG